MITVISETLAVCSSCQYRFSLPELAALRRAISRRRPRILPTPAIQTSFLDGP